MFRVEAERHRQVGDRLVIVAFAGLGIAARGESCRQLRVAIDGLTEALDGAVEIALLMIGDAEVIKRRCVGGIKFDRPFEVGDGVIEVRTLVARDAAIVISHRVFRIEPDRGIVVRQRAVQVALLIIGIAAVVIGGRKVRIDRDRAVEGLDGVV